jgi:hypothetical protein
MALSRYRNVKRPDQLYPNVTISERNTDLFIEYSVDDRLDNIAHRIYGESSYWWIILLANPEYDMEYMIEPGELIRIPLPLNSVVAEIKEQL